MFRRNRPKPRGWLLLLLPLALLLAGAAGGGDAALPAAGPGSAGEAASGQTGALLRGSSLESLGYALEVRGDFGVYMPQDVAPLVEGKPQPAQYRVMEGGEERFIGKYGAYMLEGSYTYIAGIVPFDNGDYRIDFMFLQAFEKAALQEVGACVAVGDTTVPVTEFADNPVYEDETIAVYDMYPLASPKSFAGNLDLFVRTLYRVFPINPEEEEPPPLPPDREHPDYTYLQDTYDYVRANLKGLIHQGGAGAP